jgi:hypothetical protein
MKEYADSFNAGSNRKKSKECRKAQYQREKKQKWLEKSGSHISAEQKATAIAEIKEIQRYLKSIPYSNPMDKGYKRVFYIRYADDFLIGVIGSKEDCAKIKEDICGFLADILKLELSNEKTLITHAQKSAHFLGYGIYIRKSNLAKRDCIGRLKRDYVGRVVLEVDSATIKARLLDYKAMKLTYVNGKEIWKPTSRYSLKDNDDLEILEKYNSEIRGFYNY